MTYTEYIQQFFSGSSPTAILLYFTCVFFLIYSVLGWCLEVAYHAVTMGKFVNRGFLNGPYCPIYGAGAILVIFLLDKYINNIFLLFLASLVVATILEFIVGFVLEKFYHTRCWDYSNEFLHIGPYVCLKFSVFWGLICVFVVKILHPFLLTLVVYFPPFLGWILFCCFSAILIADFIVSGRTARTLKLDVEQMSKLSASIHAISDQIGKKVSDATLNIMNKTESGRQHLESLKKAPAAEGAEATIEDILEGQKREDAIFDVEALQKEKAKLEAELKAKLESRSFGRNRFLSAYPHMTSTDAPEAMVTLKQESEARKNARKEAKKEAKKNAKKG